MLYGGNYPSYADMFDNEYLLTSHNGFDFGVYKRCGWLKSEFDAGRVAVIANAFCSKNRRHDQSQLNANAGDPVFNDLLYDRDGWGGRLIEQLPSPANTVELSHEISAGNYAPTGTGVRTMEGASSPFFGERMSAAGFYGEMFPEREANPDKNGKVPLETSGADVLGQTSTEKILSEVCEWKEPGSSSSVFPGAGSAETEVPVPFLSPSSPFLPYRTFPFLLIQINIKFTEVV